MEEIILEGDNFERVAKAFYGNSEKSCNIDEMSKWKIPLKFKENGSLILNQTRPGPCGLFASIQANIIVDLIKTNGQMETNDLLYSSILQIMSLIKENQFAFCTSINYSEKKAIFKETKSSEEARNFLSDTKYNELDNSCLLLGFSFVYLASSYEWFNNLPAPFVYDDMNTSMQFVFLMVSGRIDGESPNQKHIAIKVSHNNNPALNKYWMNEKATVIVVLYGEFHFFAVMKDGEKGLIFDTLGNGNVSSVSLNSL